MTPQHALAQDFLGHPKGLYICFFTEMWERFSFYGMKALLLLYLLKYHLYTDDAGYDLLGAYGGLVYTVPLLGGLLADRYLGMRKAVVFGGVLLVLGHLGMAYEGHAAQVVDGVVVRDAAALQVFYLSLALIVMGVGFLKSNISTIVGRLYDADDPRRDSGFTLFYAGINVGALCSSLVCAFLGETYGWKYGFGAAGIGMIAGLAVFIWGQPYLQGHAEPPQPQRLRERVAGIPREAWIYAGGVAGVLLIWQLIQRTWTVHGAMHLVAVAFGLWFIWFLLRKCTAAERAQMLSLVVLIVAVLVFFTLYEQTYGSWITFTDRLLTKDLFGIDLGAYQVAVPWALYALAVSPVLMIAAMRASDRGLVALARGLFVSMGASLMVALIHDVVMVRHTAGSLSFLGAFFIVLLAPLFAWFWPWLQRRGWNPATPVKMGLGLVMGGLAFLPMVFAAQIAGEGALASVWWLVLAYLLLAIGEVCLSPIGLSAVTQLSVPRVVGVMMGAFWLATAYSEMLAAQFGKLASVQMLEQGGFDMAQAAVRYADLFWTMTAIGIVAGAVMLLLSPLLWRAMRR